MLFFVVTTTTSNNSQVPQVHSHIARLLALSVRNNDVSTSTTGASSTELVPLHSNHRTKYPYRRRQTVEVNEHSFFLYV